MRGRREGKRSIGIFGQLKLRFYWLDERHEVLVQTDRTHSPTHMSMIWVSLVPFTFTPAWSDSQKNSARSNFAAEFLLCICTFKGWRISAWRCTRCNRPRVSAMRDWCIGVAAGRGTGTTAPYQSCFISSHISELQIILHLVWISYSNRPNDAKLVACSATLSKFARFHFQFPSKSPCLVPYIGSEKLHADSCRPALTEM